LLCHLQIDGNPDPDPASHFDVDPDADPGADLGYQDDADPCGSGCGFTTLDRTIRLIKKTFYIRKISKSPVPEDVETYGSIAVDVWMIDPGRKYNSISSHTEVSTVSVPLPCR
jgi:hypothetical protein